MPGVALAGLLVSVACSPVHRDSERALEPRFVAVHNALAAMGLAQVGPIHEGVLGEAKEARVSLALPAGCVTLVALGGEGVRDLDATLLDAHGAPVAHDTTAEPQAVLRACVDVADTYVAIVKVASGAGSWVLATWVGGVGGSSGASGVASGSSGPNAAEPRGTCDSPIPLSVGTVTGSTSHGDYENTGSCGPSDSRELVYELDVRERQRVTIAVEARFDTVIYLRKDTCADATAEIDCNDDASDRTHSRIEHVLDPGKYYVFVDGYGHETGTFKMTVTATTVLALADVCRRAPVLVQGAVQGGRPKARRTTQRHRAGRALRQQTPPGRWSFPRARECGWSSTRTTWRPSFTCATRAPTNAARLRAGSRVQARATQQSPASSTAANTPCSPTRERRARAGAYSLLLETSSAGGAGAPSDACGDATPLSPAAAGKVGGDTFAARDDVAGSCGGAGAADVVYRVDVARRSRFTASLDGEEGSHLLIVWRRCNDRIVGAGLRARGGRSSRAWHVLRRRGRGDAGLSRALHVAVGPS